MDENSGNAREDRETGPTYKSLFLAACAIIGAAFGWWFTNFISEFNSLSARVAVLEVRDTEVKWTFLINVEKLGIQEDRLRTLEREHDQHPKRDRKE